MNFSWLWKRTQRRVRQKFVVLVDVFYYDDHDELTKAWDEPGRGKKDKKDLGASQGFARYYPKRTEGKRKSRCGEIHVMRPVKGKVDFGGEETLGHELRHIIEGKIH